MFTFVKKFLVLSFLILSVFSFSWVNADESFNTEFDNIMSDINNILWTDNTETKKTPLEKARDELKQYEKWDSYVSLIDNFVSEKSYDIDYLKRISEKVKSFDFSKYNSPSLEKNIILKAVIVYIDLLLDDTINKNQSYQY
jgi:uncharacterized membrane protein YgaE (UPF0421/DUF939 family)